MRRRLNLVQAPLLIILALCVSGCNAPTDITQCPDELIYIGVDDNVYLYDVCEDQTTRLTDDANTGNKQGYTFFYHDQIRVWSPDGESLLVLNNQTVYLIRLDSLELVEIGEADTAAWSSSGDYLLLHSGSGYTITIVDAATYQPVANAAGFAPAWLSDEQVLYFVEQDNNDDDFKNHYQLYRLSISGETVPLDTYLSTFGMPAYSRVSHSGNYIMTYRPEGEFATNISVIGINSEHQTDLELPSWESVQWASATDMLVMCASQQLLLANFDDDLEDTYLDGQSCWWGSRISWNAGRTQFAYLAFADPPSVIHVTGITNLEVVNSILWIDENLLGGGELGGPYLSASGDFVAVIYEGQIFVLSSLTGQTIKMLLSNEYRLLWRPS